MGRLSTAQFVAYAREQIRTADVLLAGHALRGQMCTCGRVPPCSVALSLTRRRRHFIDSLACVLPGRAVGRAPIRRVGDFMGT